MAEITIESDGYRCERCGHEWVKRSKHTRPPLVCPKCKTAYWNIPKKEEKEQES
jgi:predicted Zn-ribbon and HTH transcriptional regulator